MELLYYKKEYQASKIEMKFVFGIDSIYEWGIIRVLIIIQSNQRINLWE